MRLLPLHIFTLSILMTPAAWCEQLSIMVDSVKDGDTILVTYSGKQEQLQLLGIDAPEDVPNPKLQRDIKRTKQTQEQLLSIGKLATLHLKKLAAPGTAILVEANMVRRDRYGRIPATVRNSEGRNLSSAMVEDGYAVVMGSYPFNAELKSHMQQQQEMAINNRMGLWGSNTETTKAWGGK